MSGAPSISQPGQATAPQPMPQITCDYCELPMPLPPGAVVRGRIIGLLKCSLCIEDELCARVGGYQP